MPTGYTYTIANGETESLADYALSCARAFFGHMRDRSGPLVYSTETSFHEEMLRENQAELERLESMSKTDLLKEGEKRLAESIQRMEDARQENDIKMARYREMLAKVKDFDPPEGWEELKSYMIRQLIDSMNYDDLSSYFAEAIERQTKISPLGFVKGDIDRLRRDVKHYQEEISDMESRCKETNDLITRLYSYFGREVPKREKSVE